MQSHKEVYTLKMDAASMYDSVCFICHKKYGRGFLFHHLKYIFAEKTYRDFKDTVRYNAYIIPKVLKCLDRFLLLCTPCHRTLSKLKQRKKDNFLRLLMAYWLTE